MDTHNSHFLEYTPNPIVYSGLTLLHFNQFLENILDPVPILNYFSIDRKDKDNLVESSHQEKFLAKILSSIRPEL